MFYFTMDENYAASSSAYDIGITGTHGQSKLYITDSLRELIDKFCIDYYKANK